MLSVFKYFVSTPNELINYVLLSYTTEHISLQNVSNKKTVTDCLTQWRFSNLSLLSIENDLKNQFKTEDIINTFATEDKTKALILISNYFLLIFYFIT